MSETKDTIHSAIRDIVAGAPADAKDKINTSLFAKVSDALKTKKMEISNIWLNDIQPESSEEEEE